MVTLELGTIEFNTKSEIAYALEDIASSIEMGYTSGITNSGICWSVDGDEEFDEEFEEEDY